MKNKGTKHLAGVDSSSGSMNQKGCLTHVTRPVTSMSPKGHANSKFDKKKWIKRIRGYWKSQTKDIL